MGEFISISFSVSDGFAQHLAVAMASMLANNPSARFRFHVLHSDLREANCMRIAQLARSFPGSEIEFHRLDEAAFADLPLPAELEHVTREMYYRYMLPEILRDEKRTIYSDVDVLCVGDLRPLWETDLGGAPLAAVPDDDTGWKRALLKLPAGRYFCSGLLVMDLERMRAEGSAARLFAATREHGARLSWPDQDAINMVFDGRIAELDARWNCTAGYRPWRRDVRQWHFQGFVQKPWCNIWKNVTWLPYLKYLLKSPYRANALKFALGHVKGIFWYSYAKKGVRRWLFCGIRVFRKAETNG